MKATDTKFRSRFGVAREKPITARRRASLVIAAAAAAAVAIPAAAAASTGSSAVAGHVYVNDNTAGTNTIGAFDRHADGSLTPEAGSPFADGQMAPCWVEISHDGQFLFTVNTASGTISRYSIAPGGTLTLLGSTTVGASGAVDARLSPDGRYLYIDESKIGAVGEFAVNGGNLTELAGSPVSLPAGATPAGIVAN